MDNDFESHKERAKEYAREQRKKAYQKAKEYKKSLQKNKKEASEEELRMKAAQKEKAREYRRKMYAEQKAKLKAEKQKEKLDKKHLEAKRKTIQDSTLDLKLVRFDEKSGTMVKQTSLPPVLRLIKNEE